MYKKLVTISLLFFMLNCVNAASNGEFDRVLNSQSQLVIDAQQKIKDLQSEVDILRGQLEETTYQLNQTIERQKMILQEMAKNKAFTASATQNNSSSTNIEKVSNESNLADWQPSGNDKNDYNFLIKFVTTNKQNNDVIIALQQFLKTYPKSSYTANVNYWLGQLFYRQAKKDDAAYYYAIVTKDYPSSPKAPDSLYKIGLILLNKGDKPAAKMIFQQVLSKYPKDKIAVEQATKQLSKL